MRHAHHSIDYVEIYVDDVAAAKRFYGEVIGWKFNDDGDAYAGIQAPDGDGEVGGITVGDRRGGSPLVHHPGLLRMQGRCRARRRLGPCTP